MGDIDTIIDEVIHDPDKIASLDEKVIRNSLEQVIPVLKKEKSLIEISSGAAYVGDTHGDFETTKAIVKRFFNKGILVFLGDYIDREPMRWWSIYNVTYLLFLKYRFPEKIILLKGNHECNYLIPCFPYEFESEIVQRFGSSKLHGMYVEAFSYMPLMVISGKVFAAHGGIVKGAGLSDLRRIDKNDIKAVESLVWSDPVVSPTFRGAGDSFDEGDLTEFLDDINARVFIRGHDYNTLGVSIYRDRCLTIFSSRRYKDMGNGGILVARDMGDVVGASDLVFEDFSRGRWVSYMVARR